MRCTGDGFRNIPLILFVRHRARPVNAEVARRFGIKLGAVFSHGIMQIDHRRQFLVFDLHKIRCVLRGSYRLGDHHCDRISDMHDLFTRQRGPERHDHLSAAASRHRRMP